MNKISISMLTIAVLACLGTLSAAINSTSAIRSGQTVVLPSQVDITFTADITEPYACNTVPVTLATITVSDVAGGTPPYTYSDNNGDTYQDSDEFTDLEPGTYDVVVKDANDNVSAPESVTVDETRVLVGNPIEDYITTKYCKGSCTTPANE